MACCASIASSVRHAANELNWQVEDLCAYGLTLKHELVGHFNEEDICTFQLCFAIKTKPQTGLFASIVIRSHYDSLTQTGLHAEQFEILHTRDFNPSSKDFVSFRKKISRENLSWFLVQLCDLFVRVAGCAGPTPLPAGNARQPGCLPRRGTALPVLSLPYGVRRGVWRRRSKHNRWHTLVSPRHHTNALPARPPRSCSTQ